MLSVVVHVGTIGGPLHDHITYVSKQIQAANTLPALMTTAFVGLEMVERAITLLIEIAPEESYASYATALAEATDAWWALSEAPSLSWPTSSELIVETGHREFAEAIAQLVMVISQGLLNAVNKVRDPADRVACLKAASHAGHVHAALQ